MLSASGMQNCALDILRNYRLTSRIRALSTPIYRLGRFTLVPCEWWAGVGGRQSCPSSIHDLTQKQEFKIGLRLILEDSVALLKFPKSKLLVKA